MARPGERFFRNVSPHGSAQVRGLDWEWRSYFIYVTSLPYISDVRVRGEFQPPPLKLDTDMIVVHPMMGAALAFRHRCFDWLGAREHDLQNRLHDSRTEPARRH